MLTNLYTSLCCISINATSREDKGKKKKKKIVQRYIFHYQLNDFTLYTVEQLSSSVPKESFTFTQVDPEFLSFSTKPFCDTSTKCSELSFTCQQITLNLAFL